MTQMEEIWSDRIPEEIKQLICSYAPYSLLSMYSKRRQRAISVSHFAQSLDGLIADSSGNSKWIGNRENLIHAHRMRAICDGIIIGSRTLKSDNPRLNVRHVKGPNPTRIILGSIGDNIDSMLAANSNSIWVIGGDWKLKHSSLRYISLKRKNKYINCLDILRTLYHEGIHSVYIEGGAITTSQFMREGMIDIYQLHISPMILCRGVKSMSNLQIDKINNAIRFSRFTYNHIGNEFMFVGEPIRESQDD
ncbi:RibD family protein, partial [Caldithrix abyssi]|nr:RibD family protein [Caldithrix abyssi]